MQASRTVLNVLILGLSATPGYAFWCDHHLISEGISEAEVRQQCGPPAQVILLCQITFSTPLYSLSGCLRWAESMAA